MKGGWRSYRKAGQAMAKANLKTRGYFKIAEGQMTAGQVVSARGSRLAHCAVGQRYFTLIRKIGSNSKLIGHFATRSEAEHWARLICRDEGVRLVFALE